MNEDATGEETIGYCEAKGRTCLSGQRAVRRYPDTEDGFLFCSHCWPHRRRLVKLARHTNGQDGRTK